MFSKMSHRDISSHINGNNILAHTHTKKITFNDTESIIEEKHRKGKKEVCEKVN